MRTKFKIFFIAILAVAVWGCSNDDDTPKLSELEQKFMTIENAVYKNEAFPSSTTEEKINGIDMSNQVMNGAMNYISIATEQKFSKFFIGIKGLNGFFEYVPSGMSQTRSNVYATEYNTYVIPVMMSESYSGNSTIILSGQLDNGDITIPVENDIFYIETMPGAIEVKLSFSNSKDVDLHLYTPSGEHIFYGNRGGAFADEFGDSISYGLDIDSNAGCNIDGINKENIYIPAELVEDGTYTVVVDMYENCESSIPTNWSIVTRYQGDIITPTMGVNPSSGVYPSGASNGDMTKVMTFTVGDANNQTRSSSSSKINWYNVKKFPLSDMDEMKLIEQEYRDKFK